VTLKSGLGSFNITENDTIRKLGYGFLLAFHSNHGHTFSRFHTIHERNRHHAGPPYDGLGRAYALHRAAKIVTSNPVTDKVKDTTYF